MAKRKSLKKSSTRLASRKDARTTRIRTAKPLPPLTGVARELFTHVLNSIAFENYDDCCAIDDLATRFGKTSGRLRPAIRKLAEHGYVTVEGDIFPIVYPTVAALRQQDPKLSVTEAKAILAKVRRG